MRLILLLLLFSTGIKAQNVCGTNTIPQVDACTVEDKFYVLLKRLAPNVSPTTKAEYEAKDPCDPLTVDDPDTPEIETCPVWNPKKDKYYIEVAVIDPQGNPTKTIHERLVMLNKPTYPQFQAELLLWATERKDDITFRLELMALDRKRKRAIKCGINQPNIKLLFKKIIKDKDQAKKTCLESKTAELDQDQSKRAAKFQVIKDIEFGKSLALDFILMVRAGTKNKAKTKRLLAKLRDVEKLLSVGSIQDARDDLAAVSVDGDFPQVAKDVLLAKMDAYLGAQ